jgi:hypothetical protein
MMPILPVWTPTTLSNLIRLCAQNLDSASRASFYVQVQRILAKHGDCYFGDVPYAFLITELNAVAQMDFYCYSTVQPMIEKLNAILIGESELAGLEYVYPLIQDAWNFIELAQTGNYARVPAAGNLVAAMKACL